MSSIIYNWIIGVCWLVFLGYWLVMGVKSKRTISNPWRQGLLVRLLMFVVVLVLVMVGVPYRGFVPTPWEGWLGVMLSVLGVGLAIWARHHLGHNWGMPMSVKEKPELVASGPYQYIRHPIYSGVLLAFLGSTLVISGYWIVLLAGSGYFIYSAMQEEKLLAREFPEQYPAYRKRTWMLIPYLF